MTVPNMERSLNVSSLCNNILSITNKVHCSAFINSNGRIMEFQLRDEDKIKNLTKHELEILHMQSKLQLSMNMEFDKKLGQLDYTMICREATLEFMFPCFEGVIFVSLSKDISIPDVSKEISEQIIKFKFGVKVENLR